MFLPFSMPPVGRWDRPTGTAQVPRSTPLRPLCSQPGWERPGPGPASGSANALLPGWLSLGTSASLGMPAHLQSRWAGPTGRLGGGGYDAGVRLVSGEEAGHADWVVGPESNPGRCSRLAVALASAFRDDPVIAWVFPDQLRRRRVLPAYMEFRLRRLAFPHDQVWMSGDGAAAAVWIPPPGTWQAPRWQRLRLLPPLIRFLGLRTVSVLGGLNRMEERHPHDPPH